MFSVRRRRISAARDYAALSQSIELRALSGDIALNIRSDGAKARIRVQRHPERIPVKRVPPVLVIAGLERFEELRQRRILLAIEQRDRCSQTMRVHRAKLGLGGVIPRGCRAAHVECFLRLAGCCEELRQIDGSPKVVESESSG